MPTDDDVDFAPRNRGQQLLEARPLLPTVGGDVVVAEDRDHVETTKFGQHFAGVELAFHASAFAGSVVGDTRVDRGTESACGSGCGGFELCLSGHTLMIVQKASNSTS